VECGQAARRWSRWKAQQDYRASQAGKEKRNRQSRRYRERVKMRPQAAPEEAVAEPARGITENFFRPLLRPAWLLRRLRATASFSPPALLFACMPARPGTSLATRTAVEPRDTTTVADLSWFVPDKPDILIAGTTPLTLNVSKKGSRRGCCAGPG